MTGAPAITLTGSHAFRGTLLFDTLALTLPGGQWTCLLGPSGVGKTTMLRLLLDLETGGSFSGAITASDAAPLQGRISYMAQSDLLMPWLSVRENVILGARLRGEHPDMSHAQNLIDRVGLGEHAAKKPHQLSGGMRQRVALARTLMEARPVVLLDEPFSALDAGTRADMQELAAEMLIGKTVLLVTHDPAEATRLGHQIILMSADGATAWPMPDTQPVRDNRAPGTLACQAALLDHLRGHIS